MNYQFFQPVALASSPMQQISYDVETFVDTSIHIGKKIQENPLSFFLGLGIIILIIIPLIKA